MPEGREDGRSGISRDTGGAIPPPSWAEPSHSPHSTHAHSRKASPKAGLPGPSRSSPTSLQPQLLQAACPPPTLPSHPSLHVSDPSHVLFLCRDHYFFSLFPPGKPGFPICLLRLAADTVLMPFPTPEATSTHFHCLPWACSGNGGGVANTAQTPGARESRAQQQPQLRSQGQVDEPQLPCPSLRGTISGHHLQFPKGRQQG